MVDMKYIGDMYGKAVDSVIKDKLQEMSRYLYEKGEFFLSETLLDLAIYGSPVTMEELHKAGYYLEVTVPDFERTWDSETEVYTARANLEEITVTLNRMIVKV